MFDWNFAFSILPDLVKASRITIIVTSASFFLALIGGLIILGLRFSKHPLISKIVAQLVDFIRGTPLLVQVFFIYYITPEFGLTLGPIETGILALSVHYSCYMSEAYRSAMFSIPKGQWEAARALGLKPQIVFSKIIWPQMQPLIVPIGGSYLVYMFKDTPILAAITVRELLQVSAQIGADNFRYMEPLTIVGVLFLIMSMAAAFIIRRIERAVKIP